MCYTGSIFMFTFCTNLLCYEIEQKIDCGMSCNIFIIPLIARDSYSYLHCFLWYAPQV